MKKRTNKCLKIFLKFTWFIGIIFIFIILGFIFYFIKISSHLDYEEALVGYSHSIKESKQKNRFIIEFKIPPISVNGKLVEISEAWLEQYKSYPTILIKVKEAEKGMLENFWFRIEHISEPFARTKIPDGYLYNLTSLELKRNVLSLTTNVTNDTIPLITTY